MAQRKFPLAFVGTVLAGILSGSATYAQDFNQTLAEDQQAAELMQKMFKDGYLKMDPQTGRILMKKSVFETLKNFSENDFTLPTKVGTNWKTGGGCQ